MNSYTSYALVFFYIVTIGACSKKKKATPVAVATVKTSAKKDQIANKTASDDESKNSEILFSERDFIESTDNRDPFRNYFNDFIAPKQQQPATIQRDVILPRYGVDELVLVAIVSGGVRSRAMFRDPTGLGVSVKRGDYMGKSANRVKEILSDSIVLEVAERGGADKTADRVIQLHQHIPEANFASPEKKTN